MSHNSRIVFEPSLRCCLAIASGGHSGFVECIYLIMVFRYKSNMHRFAFARGARFPGVQVLNGTIAECESDDGLRFPDKIALIGFGCHFERPQAGRLVEQERTTVLHRQYSGTQSSGQSSSNLVHATVDGKLDARDVA
jgi:hypothetical protein